MTRQVCAMMYQRGHSLTLAQCDADQPMPSISFGQDCVRDGFRALNSDGKFLLDVTLSISSALSISWLSSSMVRIMQNLLEIKSGMSFWCRADIVFCDSGIIRFFWNVKAYSQRLPQVAGWTGKFFSVSKMPSSARRAPSPASGRRLSPALCRISPLSCLLERAAESRMRALK